MVKQSREPFLPPFLCCFSHTAQSLGHSFPALCRDGVGLNDVLLGPHPFLPRLRRRSLFFVRLVHRERRPGGWPGLPVCLEKLVRLPCGGGSFGFVGELRDDAELLHHSQSVPIDVAFYHLVV